MGIMELSKQKSLEDCDLNYLLMRYTQIHRKIRSYLLAKSIFVAEIHSVLVWVGLEYTYIHHTPNSTYQG